MKKIGLTGGIGSGKSSVAAMFAQLGATIIDADAIARHLMEPGQEVLALTVQVFGQEILKTDGTLDRAKLASLIFSDETARQKLNGIVHPAVRQKSQELVAAAQDQPDFSGIVIEDIPLLTETGQADRFDAVIVVETDLETRLDRLEKYRGMEHEDALARIQSQASDQERRAVATWIIDNSHSLEHTRQQVLDLWDFLKSTLIIDKDPRKNL